MRTYSTETSASRDNRCLVELLSVLVVVASDSVARFVDRCSQSVLLRHAQSFALDSHHDAITSVLEVTQVSAGPKSSYFCI
jgi:hypothetical protein